MDLLKEGVKSLSRILNSSMDMNSMDMQSSTVSSSCKTKQGRNSKQMVLNSKLELLGTNKAIKVSHTSFLTLCILFSFSFFFTSS